MKSASEGGDVQRAVQGVKYLVALQTGSRLLTFALNTLIVRHVSRDVLGLANVQLHFLYHFCVSLCREPARRVCARPGPGGGSEELHRQRRNFLAWACSAAGAVASALLGTLFWYVSTAEELAAPRYFEAVALMSLACAVELMAEPFHVELQRQLLFGTRVLVEASSLVLKCLVQYVLVCWFGWGLLAFPLAQLMRSAALAALYVLAFAADPSQSARPALPSARPWVDPEDAALLLRFSWQALQSVLLAQGENFVLKFFQTLESQGSFSVVNNLGSLVVRFLFLPVEERFVSLVGLLFIAFGPPFSFALLDVLYGRIMSEGQGPALLAVYCAYVGLVGLNGISEAFVNAAASPSQLSQRNWQLLLLSALHMVSSAALVTLLGAPGVVLANCLTMGVRIATSAAFIAAWAPQHGVPLSLRGLLPSTPVLAAFAASAAATHAARTFLPYESVWGEPLQASAHILVGAVALLGVGVCVSKCEKEFLAQLRALWKQKQG